MLRRAYGDAAVEPSPVDYVETQGTGMAAGDRVELGSGSVMIRFSAMGSPRRRLLCLPFAGGGPSTYRLWPKALPDDVEVIAVALPGRDPRSRPANIPASISEIVDLVVDDFVELQTREPLPFALFGHSMGALIAFELTVALEQRGGPPPSNLFVSGRRPPDELHRGEHIHRLDDTAFLDAVHRLYGAVPEAVRNEPELLALFLPALRADVEAFETYVPRSDRLVRCPVRVYGGADDRHPRASDLAGWQRVAEGDVSIQIFPGDHFFLVGAREALTADLAAHWCGEPAALEPR
jgi:medium-chain acyl-[acyl-carrier-protein] hydrolase